MKTLGQYLGIFFVLSILAGCSGGGSSNSNSSIPSTGVSGTITDMSGAALEGATIFVGSNRTLSDSEGQFSLDTGVGDISVTATLLNYTQNNRVVTVESGTLSIQNLKLAVIDTFEEFDANLGATLAAKSASIVLPTSYVLEDGSAYTGTVSARATYNKVTTTAGLEAFPGPFLGEETGGETKVLQSYGFIDVTLKNSEGANVNLADSATATLTYPMDENITETPATIPLWYFDTTKGIWVEEGEATYDAVTNTYSGTVTHFSTWNLDKKFDGATLQGCIEDSEGQRVPLADIYISAEGWNRRIVNNDTTGTFEFINAPSGIELSIVAKYGDQSSTEQKVTLASGDTRIMGSCLVLDIDSTELFTSVSGAVVNSSNAPLANQPVVLYSVVNGASVYQAQTNTDADGKFGITVKRSNIENIKLSLTKRFGSQSLGFNHYYSIDPVRSVTDVGSIKLAATIVDACITLEAGSATTGGVTTLADGITTVDDGTTIAGSGFTSFGTDDRQLRIDGPYGVDYNIVTFNQTGTFTFVFPQDNLTHALYAHVYDTSENEYTLTGSMSVVANTDSIDLTRADECIELHKMRKSNKTATVSVSSNDTVHLEVNSPTDYHFVSENPRILSKTFVIDENGEYIIKQATDSFDDTVSGTIKLTIEGRTQTVTIPSPSNSEFWTGFVIESYDGDITVKTINKNYYQ